MARRDEDILLGTLDPAIGRDSDGDGVGDMQERLDGTDPGDAADVIPPVRVVDPVLVPDPRGDPGGPIPEPETLDPRAAIPEGMTVDTALVGMTNIDGTSISFGTDHDGIGDDSILEGRLGANSPRDVTRDIATSTSTFVPTSGDGGGTEPPPGIPGKYDLVSAEDGGTEFDILSPIETGIKIYNEKMGNTTTKADAGTVRPDGDTAVPKPAPEKVWKAPTYSTNPDADVNAPVTVEEVERAITLSGAATKPVVGDDGVTPVLDTADVPGRFDLVSDPSPDADSSQPITMVAPTGPADAPVINVINPDAGVAPRPTGGVPPTTDGGGFDPITGSSAATATFTDGSDAGGISVVGGQPSGIQTVAYGDSSASSGYDPGVVSAGDDDDLEELEVQRNTNPDADPDADPGAVPVDGITYGRGQANELLADAPAGIIIPDYNRDADMVATVEPLNPVNFADRDADLLDAGLDAGGLFGDDPALDG